MQHIPGRLTARIARAGNAALGAVAGGLVVLLLKAARRTDPEWMSAFAGRFLRRLGPWLPEHKVGRANLTAAFPEKPAGEIDDILAGVWTNLGRVGAEYAHLDRLWDYDPTGGSNGRIEASAEDIARFESLRASGQPSLFFTAHLANWELPALAAATHGLDATILYRRPNIGNVAEAINRIRAVNMGTLIATGPDAVFRVAGALERGGHVGMLVDQHFSRGVDVEFFGRRCKANPLIARLARNFECPIYGTRVIRLPQHRFRVELAGPLEPPRAADGRIDIAGTMQAITSVIETWVREYPDQWLWLHRRWR